MPKLDFSSQATPVASGKLDFSAQAEPMRKVGALENAGRQFIAGGGDLLQSGDSLLRNASPAGPAGDAMYQIASSLMGDPVKARADAAHAFGDLQPGEQADGLGSRIAGGLGRVIPNFAAAVGTGGESSMASLLPEGIRSIPIIGKALGGIATGAPVAANLTGIHAANLPADMSTSDKLKETGKDLGINLAMAGLPLAAGKSVLARLLTGGGIGYGASAGASALSGQPQDQAQNIVSTILGAAMGQHSAEAPRASMDPNLASYVATGAHEAPAAAAPPEAMLQLPAGADHAGDYRIGNPRPVVPESPGPVAVTQAGEAFTPQQGSSELAAAIAKHATGAEQLPAPVIPVDRVGNASTSSDYLAKMQQAQADAQAQQQADAARQALGITPDIQRTQGPRWAAQQAKTQDLQDKQDATDAQKGDLAAQGGNDVPPWWMAGQHAQRGYEDLQSLKYPPTLDIHPNAPGNRPTDQPTVDNAPTAPKRKQIDTGRKDSKGRPIMTPAIDYSKGDGLLQWLAANGGIDAAAMKKQTGLDPASTKDPSIMNPLGKIGLPAVRANGGMSIEHAFERMSQDGWFPGINPDAPPAVGAQEAADMIHEALNGQKVYHPTEGQDSRYADQQDKQLHQFHAEQRDMNDEAQAQAAQALRQNQIAPANHAEALTVAQLINHAQTAGATPAQLMQALKAGATPQKAAALWDIIRQLETDHGTDTRGVRPSGEDGHAAPQGRPAATGASEQEPHFALEATGAHDTQADPAKVAPAQTGLFAAPTVAEHVRAQTESKDASRNGLTGSKASTGDGGLFDGKRPEQVTVPGTKAMGFEEFAAKNGASRQSIGDAGTHKRNTRQSEKQWSKIVAGADKRSAEVVDRRAELRKQYDEKVASGELRPLTRQERLEQTAAGHPDNPSTQAARRLLDGQKTDHANTLDSIESQTDTPAFKHWFGDSKVVDAKGQPLVVYHGTNKSFTVFDRKRSIGGQYWFTTDKAAIDSGDVGAAGKGKVIDAYLSIKSPAGWPEYNKWGIGELIREGYDGLALPDGGSTTYVAFEPNQIKSASRNKGAFDPASKSILDSLDHSDEALAQQTLDRYHAEQDTAASNKADDKEMTDYLREQSQKQGERDARSMGLHAAVESALGGMGGKLRVEFLHDEDGLPEGIHLTKPEGKGIRAGLYITGSKQVFIFTGHSPSKADAAFTAAHEVYGHRAMRLLAEAHPGVKVGNRTVAEALDHSLNMAVQNPTVRTVAESMARQRTAPNSAKTPKAIFNALPDSSRLAMIEEAMADLSAAHQTGNWDKFEAKHGTKVPPTMREGVKGAIAKFIEHMRRILNAIMAKITGKPADFTDAQVHDFMHDAADQVKGGKDLAATGKGGKDGKALDQTVFHGTPHRGIEQTGFKLQHIGSGEGAQAYGWGMYFAGREEVAEHYRKALTKQFYAATDEAGRWGVYTANNTGRGAGDQLVEGPFKSQKEASDSAKLMGANKGQLYHAEVPEDSELLHYDKPLSEQPAKVRAALKTMADSGKFPMLAETMQPFEMGSSTGDSAYRAIRSDETDRLDGGHSAYPKTSIGDASKAASEALDAAGIPGLKYLDGSSRNRPFKDVVREFRKELPDDADFEDVTNLLGTGTFSPKNEALLKALNADGWLGFDHPSQAISAALGGHLDNWDPSPELVKAVSNALDGGTHNYVIWNEGAISDVHATLDSIEPNPDALEADKAMPHRNPGESQSDYVNRVIGKNKDQVRAATSLMKYSRKINRMDMRGMMAKQERAKAIADAVFTEARKSFDRTPDVINYASVDQWETGAKIVDPDFREFVTHLQAGFDQRIARIQELQPGALEQLISHYMPHLYKDSRKAGKWYQTVMGKRPLQGDRSFLKQRTWPTLKEAMASGLEPISPNPTDWVLAKYAQMDKFIGSLELKESLASTGNLTKMAAGERVPEGMVRVEDPAFQIAGGLQGYYAVPEMIGKDINNYLKPGLSQYTAWRSLRFVQNLLVSARLGWSAFHAGFTSLDNLVMHGNVAMNRLAMGDLQGGLMTLLKTVPSIIYSPFEGGKLNRQWRGMQEADPHTAALLDLLEEGGARWKMHATDYNNGLPKVIRAVRRMTAPGAATDRVQSVVKYAKNHSAAETLLHGGVGAIESIGNGLSAIGEVSSYVIHHVLVPNQKMAARVMLLKFELDRMAKKMRKEGYDVKGGDYAGILQIMNPNVARQLATNVVNQVDYRLGQLTYDNFFFPKIAREIGQMVFMAPGWQVGTLQTVLGGFAALPHTVKPQPTIEPLDKAGKITDAHLGRVPSNLSYLLTLAILSGASNALAQYLMSGNKPDQIKDYFFPRTGRRNADDSEERLQPPTYWMDHYKLATEPVQTAMHKIHPVWGMMHELYANEDYFGTRIRNPDDPMSMQAEAVGKYLGRGFEPFSVSNAGKAAANDAGPTRLGLSFFGLNDAPASVSRTKFQDFVAHNGTRGYASFTSTPEQAEKRKTMHEAEAGMRKGDTPDMNGLTPRDQHNALKASQHMVPELRFRRLGIEDKLRAYDMATNDERTRYELRKLILVSNWGRQVRDLPQEERDSVASRIRALRH